MSYITDPIEATKKPYKYFTFLAMVWISALVISTLTVSKTILIGPFDTFIPILIYPITYILADCFTEVYGYRQTRKMIWSGFGVLAVIGFIVMPLFVHYPPHPEYADNEAFNSIFANAPLYVLAGICAYFGGEMTNSFVMAKMKLWTNGRHLWARIIGSTIFGQSIDNFIYIFIAFGITQTFDMPMLIKIWASTVFLLVLYETLATPITYKIISFLKHKEGLDVYDTQTNFNPFSFGEK